MHLSFSNLMKNSFLRITSFVMGAIFAAGLVVMITVMAVDTLGIFELEGNAIEQGTAGEDWQTLYDNGNNTGGNSVAFTGILDDEAPLSIYWQGGSKDILDVSEWRYKDGSVPDKDDITNAYAAAYINTVATGPHEVGDLIINFGLDRYANKGDAFAGFWFFQDDVALDGVDAFTGNHVDGDLLVLVEYPQGANAMPEIKVYEWRTGAGDISDNLYLLLTATDAECGLPGNKVACAITNHGNETSPWPYTPKSGTPGIFPFESFFEGSINVTELLGTTPCFNSFLAETRSSRSETAQLKDFVLGAFPLCTATVATEIHAGSDHATDIQNTTVKVGTVIHDKAIVTGSGIPGIPDPTGDVTFTLYDNLTCDGNVVTSQTVGVTGGGGGVSTAESSGYQTAAGLYSYSASYSGDGNFPAADLAHCEPLTVVKYDTMTATAIHEGTNHTTDIQGGSVFVGASVHDQGTVSLALSETDPGGLPDPTGTITFSRYATSDCTGTAVDEVVNLDDGDGGVEESSAFVTTTSGGLSYAAVYSGDGFYNGSSHSCEILTVNKFDSNIVTAIHAGSDHVTDIQNTTIKVLTSIHDQATVSGAGPDPTGTVTFRLFSDLACQTTPAVFDTVAIVADGNNDGSAAVESKSMTTAAGVLAFSASYGGDANYNPSGVADCEPLTVEKYDSMTATEIHEGTNHAVDIQGGAVNVGTTVHDLAIVSLANSESDPGGLPAPSGNVTFSRYSTANCTGSSADEMKALASGNAESSDFVTVAGSLSYSASYPGDAVYNPSSHSCEVLTVNKLVSNITTEVHDPSHTDITFGTIMTGIMVHDKAFVTGGGAIPTGTVTFNLYDNLTCDGALVSSVGVALAGDGTAETTPFLPGAGMWSFSASYGGDANYDPSGPAQCEPFTVEPPGEEGCTPGFWKNSPGSWAATSPLVSPSDLVTAWFTLPNGVINNNLSGDTLIEALDYPGGDNLLGAAQILMRAAVASLLNATHPDVDFTRSYLSVISDVNAALATKDRATILQLATALDNDNNLGCDLPNDNSF